MAEWKKICCAVDLSDASRLTFEEALELAGQLGATLTLVHVQAAAAGAFASPRAAERVLGARPEEVLEEWRGEAERRLGAPVQARLARGEPAAELRRLASEERFDLLVVGTHGGAHLGRLVLGSVADRVAREAPCPVLIARRKERSEAADVAAEAALYH